MNAIDWMQFLLGTGFLLVGVGIFAIQLFGIFKFKYVLNRMHAAAMGDTLGIGICLIGLMILSGFKFVTLKLALILIFLWLASPVASHLIARLETIVNKNLDEFCEMRDGAIAEDSAVYTEDNENNKNNKNNKNNNAGNLKADAGIDDNTEAKSEKEGK